MSAYAMVGTDMASIVEACAMRRRGLTVETFFTGSPSKNAKKAGKRGLIPIENATAFLPTVTQSIFDEAFPDG